jgi:hypothetical protein
MAAELEETPISYEELSDLENEFDEVEVEISESAPSRPCAGQITLVAND